MATPATPMLPPDIRAQAPPPPPPESVYSQAGEGATQAQSVGGDPVGVLEQLVAKLEQTTGDIAKVLSDVHPPSQALLVQIAQAGVKLKQRIQELRQQMSGRSVSPPPANPALIPSEVPSGRPMA